MKPQPQHLAIRHFRVSAAFRGEGKICYKVPGGVLPECSVWLRLEGVLKKELLFYMSAELYEVLQITDRGVTSPTEINVEIFFATR